MNREDLLSLIRPVFRPRPANYDQDLEAHKLKLDGWLKRLPTAFCQSFREIEVADKEERPIPRDAILRLAVTTNQLFRNRWELEADREKLKKAEDMVRHFRVSCILESSPTNGREGKQSRLEKAIDKELAKPATAHCRRCGRHLTATESVIRGIGPKCRRKVARANAERMES